MSQKTSQLSITRETQPQKNRSSKHGGNDIIHRRLVTREQANKTANLLFNSGDLRSSALLLRDLSQSLIRLQKLISDEKNSAGKEKSDTETSENLSDDPAKKKKELITKIKKCQIKLEKNARLHQIEMRKVKIMSESIQGNAEIKDFSEVMEGNEKSIQNLKKEILSLKSKLKREKCIRKNLEEYTALVKQAKSHPSREVTEKELSVVKGDVDTCKEKNTQLNQELEVKQKQFTLFLQCLFDLKTSLSSVQKNSEDIEEKKDLDEKGKELNDGDNAMET